MEGGFPFGGDLAHRDEARDLPHTRALLERAAVRVENEPLARVVLAECDEEGANAGRGLGREHTRHFAIRGRGCGDLLQLHGDQA